MSSPESRPRLSDPARIRELLQELEQEAKRFQSAVQPAIQLKDALTRRIDEAKESLDALEDERRRAAEKRAELERQLDSAKKLSGNLVSKADEVEEAFRAAIEEARERSAENLVELTDQSVKAIRNVAEKIEGLERASREAIEAERQESARRIDAIEDFLRARLADVQEMITTTRDQQSQHEDALRELSDDAKALREQMENQVDEVDRKLEAVKRRTTRIGVGIGTIVIVLVILQLARLF